jgi:hypothetical protein
VDTGRILVRVVCGRSNIDGGVNIIGIRGEARRGRIVVGMNYNSFWGATKEGVSAVRTVAIESLSESSFHQLVGGGL